MILETMPFISGFICGVFSLIAFSLLIIFIVGEYVSRVKLFYNKLPKSDYIPNIPPNIITKEKK